MGWHTTAASPSRHHARLATTTSSSNALPAFQVLATGNDYTGNVLELKSDKAAASDYRLLYATVDGAEVSTAY